MLKLIFQYKGLKKEIYLLCIGKVVTAMGSFIWPLMTMILNTKLGYSPMQTALTMMIMSLCQIPSTLIAGRLTDMIGRRKIIIFSDTVSIVLFLLCGFIPLSQITIVLLTLGAVFQSLEGPAYDSLMADYSLPKDREKAYSLSYLSYNLGVVFGPIIGGLLFNDYLWLAFIINGLAIAFSTIIIYKNVFEKNFISTPDKQETLSEYEKGNRDASTFYVLKKNKLIIFYFICLALADTVYNSPSFILPITLPKLYGEILGPRYYGFALSLNGLVVILATPIFTKILTKLMDINKVALGGLLIACGILVYTHVEYIYFLYLAMTIFTMGEVVKTIGEIPYLTKRIPASHRGRIFTIKWIIMGTFIQLSQLFSGFLLENYNYDTVFTIYFIIGIVSSILFYLISFKDKHNYPLLYKKASKE